MWRIYYSDGSFVSSGDSGADGAPPVGVVCIIQPNTFTGDRELIYRFDWYWWRDDESCWYGGDIHGFLDQAMRLGAQWPKQGRTMQTIPYEDIVSRALREWSDTR